MQVLTSNYSKNTIKNEQSFTSNNKSNIVVHSLKDLENYDKAFEEYTSLSNTLVLFEEIYELLNLKSKPVYVEKGENGNESIIYNSTQMKLGEMYKIEFKGEKWALRKNNKTVEFMKYYPDNNE